MTDRWGKREACTKNQWQKKKKQTTNNVQWENSKKSTIHFIKRTHDSLSSQKNLLVSFFCDTAVYFGLSHCCWVAALMFALTQHWFGSEQFIMHSEAIEQCSTDYNKLARPVIYIFWSTNEKKTNENTNYKRQKKENDMNAAYNDKGQHRFLWDKN